MTLGTDKLKSKESNADTHMPDGYYLSELGPLPKEWGVVRLGEVATITRKPRSFPLPKKIAFIPMEAIPDNGSFYPGNVVWKSIEGLSSGVYCEGGDILFAKITPSLENGKQGLVPKEIRHAYATTEVYPLKPGEQVDTFFLFQLLRAPWVRKHLVEKMEGSTGRQRLARQALMNCPIPLPPLPEQRAIAYVLRAVQEAKEATERVIAAARELKKSLMRHLFTYGPVSVGEREHVRLQETEIGPIPEHWRVVKLGELVQVRGGKRLPKGHKFSETPTPHPYLRVVDFCNGTINTRHLKYLTPEDYAVLKRYTISTKDVYISIAGSVGLVGIVPPELDGANLTENAARLVITNQRQLSQLYLVYTLASSVGQTQIHQRSTKTSQPKLALTRIRQLRIPLPPLPEQREIARILQAVDKKIEAEENRKAALEALFKSLLRDLMTARRRLPPEFIARFARESK